VECPQIFIEIIRVCVSNNDKKWQPAEWAEDVLRDALTNNTFLQERTGYYGKYLDKKKNHLFILQVILL